jgi:uncharacterized protein (DUF1015 family)
MKEDPSDAIGIRIPKTCDNWKSCSQAKHTARVRNVEDNVSYMKICIKKSKRNLYLIMVNIFGRENNKLFKIGQIMMKQHINLHSP